MEADKNEAMNDVAGGKKIAIFARTHDVTAKAVADEVHRRGGRVVWVDFSTLERAASFTNDGNRIALDEVSLHTVDGYFLRFLPSDAAPIAPRHEALTAETWWFRTLERRAQAQFARSVVWQLDASGVRAVNPHIKTMPFDNKAYQLATFIRARLPLPKTCVTNDPKRAREFMSTVDEAIAKPLLGGAPAREMDDQAYAELDRIVRSPTIFQERVRGVHIRVTRVEGDIISAVQIPTDALDYRTSDAYRRGEQQYVPHCLDAVLEEICHRAASLCGHVLSGIDLIQRDDGSYALLEVNSAPAYWEIEQKTASPITTKVVDYVMTR